MAVVAGTGLTGTYFDNPDFTGTSTARLDKKLYFAFGTAAPATGIAPTYYSVRWTGKIKPAYSETYTFTTMTDDGVRLWVNHKLIIDDWNTRAGPITHTGTVTLEASKRVDILLEYFNKKSRPVPPRQRGPNFSTSTTSSSSSPTACPKRSPRASALASTPFTTSRSSSRSTRRACG